MNLDSHGGLVNMKKFIKAIWQFFMGGPMGTLDDLYLSNAVSLADLERRQQSLMRYEQPWQKRPRF